MKHDDHDEPAWFLGPRSRLRFATSRYFVGEEEEKLEVEALSWRSNFLTSYPTRALPAKTCIRTFWSGNPFRAAAC